MPNKPESENQDEVLFERRRFTRIDGTFVVSYTDITTQERKSDISQTKDISLGGILFTTDKVFPSGTILKLKIRLPDAPDYINMKVRVVESRQRVKGLFCETRAKFISIKEENKAYISKVIEVSLKKWKKISKDGGSETQD
ncbi:MAG: PilZ domain-containing protein [Candidatus Omnitrophota bacterium]